MRKKHNYKGDEMVTCKQNVIRYDIQLTAHIAVKFDNCEVLQQLHPCCYAKADGTPKILPEERKSYKHREESSNIFEAFFRKVPQKVTFTCRYCHLKGEILEIGKTFGSENGLFKDKIDHSFI